MDKKPLGVALCVLLAGCGSDDSGSTELTCTMSGKVEELKPDEIYTDYDDGTILDTETGLMWSVCNVGETWHNHGADGKTCVATDEGINRWNTWREAMRDAQTLTFYGYLGHRDWRMPNVKELLSLVEPAGVRKTINCQFPNTADYYFSSSPVATEPSAVWYVNFSLGSAYPTAKDWGGAVRLVRDAD